jgi:phosphopantothenate-cysteine ligase/phosphopantothenoylcysteine decarboxylase/phosphopantothenate--cysteine ligase
MNILVTAGNTQTPIDRVRCITNVFTGRTGAQIATEAHRRGHSVTLLTSHPEVLGDFAPAGNWSVRSYRTFDDLRLAMTELVPGDRFDVLVHAAAVSDFEVAGIYTSGPGTPLIDVTAAKVKSHHPELWLRMVPTPKLADRVRSPWGFRGTFVKFKLEVGVSDEQLRQTAARSRAQSDADLIVANTLEGKDAVAWIGDRRDEFESVPRVELAARLLERLESILV